MANDYKWDSVTPYLRDGTIVGMLCVKDFAVGEITTGTKWITPVKTENCIGAKISILPATGFVATSVAVTVHNGIDDIAQATSTAANGSAASGTTAGALIEQESGELLSSRASVKIVGTAVTTGQCRVEMKLGGASL